MSELELARLFVFVGVTHDWIVWLSETAFQFGRVALRNLNHAS